MGAVTPLGLLNDDQLRVCYFMNSEITDTQQIVGVHPCDSLATVWLKVQDLIGIVKKHGNRVEVMEIKGK